MEYESRRDADDAYHEMHNKRIGRDDLLKIEVSDTYSTYTSADLTNRSGLGRRHLHLGDSIQAVTADVTALLPAVVARHPHVVVVVATTPLVGMTGMSGTMTVMTAIMSVVIVTTTVVIAIMTAVIGNVPVTALVALMRESVTSRMTERGVMRKENAVTRSEKMDPMAKTGKVSFSLN